MMRLAIAIVLVTLTGCEPNEAAGGQAVLLAAPIITLGALAPVWLYIYLWRKLDPRIVLSWKTIAWILAGLVALAALSTANWDRRSDDWVGFAAWFVGMSYLTVVGLCLRIAIVGSSRDIVARWIAFAWVPLLLPAVHFGLFGSHDDPLPEIIQAVWLLPGFGGWVAGGLWALLLGEVTVRIIRRRRSGL